MSKRILEELYHGNIHPNEYILPKQAEYRKVGRKISALETKLLGKLGKEEIELYESIEEEKNAQGLMEITETFIEGFRLGARIALEALSESE